jgi:hypothetical protein
MKKIIILYFIFMTNILSAQSKWAFGTQIGVNSSDIAFGNRPKDWALAYNATSISYGILTKYQFNKHWALRLELNREMRGWNQPWTIYGYRDTTPIDIHTTVDFSYYFLTAPLIMEYANRKKNTFYASLGFVPMYQTKGTRLFRATGTEWLFPTYQPSLVDGKMQWGGLANMGYRYALREQIDIYIESRFNLSFNYYEGWRIGNHYAYTAIIGIAYRL